MAIENFNCSVPLVRSLVEITINFQSHVICAFELEHDTAGLASSSQRNKIMKLTLSFKMSDSQRASLCSTLRRKSAKPLPMNVNDNTRKYIDLGISNVLSHN